MISFRKLKEEDFELLYEWCQSKTIYEWFEQRALSLEEIKTKYQKKLNEGIQKLYIIQLNKEDIGYTQIYPYEEDSYEFDLYLKEEHQSKGYGEKVILEIIKKIKEEYHPKKVVLRPFKRNERAIHCYENCGFQIIEEQEGKDTLGNKEVILLLEKEL